MSLYDAVLKGLRQPAQEATERALQQKEPLAVIEESMVPALNAAGERFEAGTLFLPQLLMCAEAAKAAFSIRSARAWAMLRARGAGTVVVATVQGDVHDIGKNIVKALLENYQFRVIDLGKDVPPEAVVEAAITHGARLVGLSALMTTTVPSMRRTIAALRESAPGCLVMVRRRGAHGGIRTRHRRGFLCARCNGIRPPRMRGISRSITRAPPVFPLAKKRDGMYHF